MAAFLELPIAFTGRLSAVIEDLSWGLQVEVDISARWLSCQHVIRTKAGGKHAKVILAESSNFRKVITHILAPIASPLSFRWRCCASALHAYF